MNHPIIYILNGCVKKILLVGIIFLMFFPLIGFSQNMRKVDSLVKLIPTASNKELFEINNTLAWMYMTTQSDKALVYAKNNFKVVSHLKQFADHKTEDEAVVYSTLGLVHLYRNEFEFSLKNLFRSYQISDSIHDKKRMAASLLNIGNVYNYQKNHIQAQKFYDESIKLKKELGDEKGMISPLINIAGSLFNQGKLLESVQRFEEAYKLAEKHNDNKNKYIIEGNLGILYRNLKDYPKSLKYQNSSLKYRRSKNDNLGVIQCLQNLAVLYTVTDSLEKAKACLEEALPLARKGAFADAVADITYNLADVYARMKEFEKAYLLGNKAKLLYDSAQSINSNKTIAEMQAQFDVNNKQRELELMSKESKLKSLESEKKSNEINLLLSEKELNDLKALASGKEITILKNKNTLRQKEAEVRKRKIELLNKEKEVKDAEIERQNLLKIAFACGFALMIALAFFIFRSLVNNRKAKKLIELQKAQVEHQKEMLEEKQKEIIDSINYAKRIQQALLPSSKYIERVMRRNR